MYTVDQYKQGKINGAEAIIKAENTLRLTAVKNETARRELWSNSIKVKITKHAFTRGQFGCLKL